MKICFAMRAPLQRYPSSVFQAEMFVEAGADVSVLDCEDGGYRANDLPARVTRIAVGRTDYSWGGFKPLLAPARRLAFNHRLRKRLDEIAPDVIVACEPPAMASVGPVRRRPGGDYPLVWHFHEYPELHPTLGPSTRRSRLYVRERAEYADLVLFPDRHRAELFAAEVSLRREPVVVMNCPRRLETVPKPTLRDRLSDYGGRGRPIVMYNGSVGPQHGIELAVESMQGWPDDALLVLIGPCNSSYRQKISALATRHGVERAVVFLGTLSPGDIWSARAGADLALTVMIADGKSAVTYKYAAGASNKRFEAMAVGVAQVTNNGPGIEEVVDMVGCGLSVPVDSPGRLGEAVAYLLRDESTRREMGRRGRDAHLERFNYEKQFSPVLEIITGGTRAKADLRRTGFWPTLTEGGPRG